ncbi:GntP family permease [Tunicatimonas pelagia]|uniref:GntP family permease n=1 Tax=Tunicatimonas pelagia TaxID=931531 RepID=UPI00266584A6|nr:GntP family permease [Tunicatimonas pelagia]WKN44998.1 GntP family permease [Tunicatimonas pelagia]
MYGLIVLVIVLLGLVLAISWGKVHPFVALLLAALALGLLMNLGGTATVNALLDGFGTTMRWIAIVVVLGAFIGEVLHQTGGAVRIAERIVRLAGLRKVPMAMGVIGYIVSIPVFVDVAYIVLQPVTEALSVRSKKPVLVIGLSLAAGLTVSHTLLPPTPGPLAVASLLGADLGRLILINATVAVFAMSGGIIWAMTYCRRFHLEYDKQLVRTYSASDPLMAGASGRLGLDLLPIVLPIVLMAGGTLLPEDSKGLLSQLGRFFSIPMVAVLIGAVVAGLSYHFSGVKTALAHLVEQAIVKSALVIMITGAGGAFGQVIKATEVHLPFVDTLVAYQSLGFLLPFLLAAVLTTATGSITVSLISTASLLGPLAGTLPYSPEIMAALIGSGSFCVFHANASFFWLLQRLHEVPVSTLYRTYTLQSLVMGLSGLLGVFVLLLLGIT